MSAVVRHGPGAVRAVAEALTTLGAQRLLLVAGRTSFTASGAAAALGDVLRRYEVARFEPSAPYPDVTDLRQAASIAAGFQPDVILAVGGGTVLDMAKLVAATTGQDLARVAEVAVGSRPPARRPPPIVAVPTTAGTGSEVTHFAVVYADGRKFSVAHPGLRPAWAIVDPDLTGSLPPAVTAASGLDALAHGIEALWSVRSTTESRGYASGALRLARTSLTQAVHHPDEQSRAAMCEAAHLGGKAIDIGFTTAPHALSYGLTARYGVPHGAAVALTLGAVLEFNGAVGATDCADPRSPEFVVERVEEVAGLLGVATAAEARAWIDTTVETIGMPTRLRDVGVAGDRALDDLAALVDGRRLGNNPRAMDAHQARALLGSVY